MRKVIFLLLICCVPLSCKKKVATADSGPKGARTAFKLPDEISRKLESLRKAGEPTTVAELRTWLDTPPLTTNAAPLYQIAFSQLPAYGTPGWRLLSTVSNLPPRNTAMAKPTFDGLSKFSAQNSGLLDSLQQATQVKECMYPLDLKEDLVSTLWSHLAKVKSCAEAMQANAYLEIENGQTDKAVETISRQVMVAESLKRNSFLIDQLVRAACLGISEQTLERLLNRRKLTAAQLDKLNHAFRAVSLKEGISRSVLGERCQAIVIIQLPPDDLKKVLSRSGFKAGLNDDGLLESYRQRATLSTNGEAFETHPKTSGYSEPDMDWQGYQESATYTQDFLFALENFELMIKAFEMPFPEALTVSREFTLNMPLAVTNRYLLASLLTPALGGLFAKYAQAEAQLRVTLGALAIERMRLDGNGGLPENGDDPAIQSALTGLLDPFDGKPIRYKRRASSSYAVYSIGIDGKDDDGVPIEARPKGQKTYDLVFIVAR